MRVAVAERAVEHEQLEQILERAALSGGTMKSRARLNSRVS